MLPLAYLISKFFNTTWTVKENPLDSLGLWLNFAQLFYFPFLIFVLLRQPGYFLMTYIIITGAHFFPYAWYYNEKSFAIMAGIIATGALFLGLNLDPQNMYLVAVSMSVALVILAIFLYTGYKRKRNSATINASAEIK